MYLFSPFTKFSCNLVWYLDHYPYQIIESNGRATIFNMVMVIIGVGT
jgi:hypothetical protein